MKRITTAIACTIATAALRHSWAIQNAAARDQARGEHMEARVHRLATRWGCVDDMIATVTSEALYSR
ncbi:hypothetical protein [Bradyrhizobium sp. AUGA SZCCT0160]|uniref:hypothetical protein n=1 Tax=Bradyrhizobium sp. AUGA SZCCT0160 TaxID=2807662 RepID=UPI001BA5DA5D|nr:hypothetical protein [Bradyrhizobium sp. AUGA SZCCT0160]MBR1189218.1 hypothetical protein [Bradyrhizobium sp. AUGA SZCCT0160]